MTNNKLPIINYQLSIVNYQLSIVNYQLSTINYQLSIILFFVLMLFGQNLYAHSATNDDDSIKFVRTYVNALKNKMLGRNKLAKEMFKECLQIKPESTVSAYQLAKILLDEKKINEAEGYAEFCLKHKQNNEWYLLLRAKIADKQNDFDLKTSLYEKLVLLQPQNADYNFKLAMIYFRKKEYDKALSLLNEVQMQIGINESVSFFKKEIYYIQKQYSNVEAELKALQKAFPDKTKYSDMLMDYYLKFGKMDTALSLKKETLKNDSNNVNSKFSLAWMYAKKGNYNKGLPFLREIITDKSLIFKRIFKLSSMYLETTKSKLNKSQTDSIYSSLANRNDFNGEFLLKYTNYLYEMKDFVKAKKYASISVEKYPENYSAWTSYFKILLELKQYEDLNKSAIKCLEYFPNQSSAYFYCGYSYFLTEKYDKAVAHLTTSVDYTTDNQKLVLMNYSLLAESYHKMQKHAKSDEYFEKYLQKNSNNGSLMNNYAWYLTERGINNEKALKLSRKSLEIEPFNSLFLDTYAWILFTQKKYKEALNYIKRAYKYGGDKNPTILEHFGDIQDKLGNSDDANSMWKASYEISKSKKTLEKIKE